MPRTVVCLPCWRPGPPLPCCAPASPPSRYFRPACASGSNRRAISSRARNFPGFEDADRKVAITILDLPAGAYDELERSANRQSLTASPGQSGRIFRSEAASGCCSPASQGQRRHPAQMDPAGGGAAPTKSLTALVNVEVPEAALAIYSDEVIRKALASVTFRPAPIQEQLRPAAVQGRRTRRFPRDEGVPDRRRDPDRRAERRPEQASLHHRLDRPRRAGAARRSRAICARPAVVDAAARHQDAVGGGHADQRLSWLRDQGASRRD